MKQRQRNFRRTLEAVYRRLFSTFGPQHWWPGETPLEVAVGAILTQNTAWKNAALAIRRLKEERLLDPKKLQRIPLRRLAQLIRPSGYFNQKARRLKAFILYLHLRHGGSVERMRRFPWPVLRKELMEISGVGPETADSILLYALEQPTFVVDAYTRRFLARHGWIPWDASYEEIQKLFIASLPHRVKLFNEFHALIVSLGKNLCQTHPKCHFCPLRDLGTLRLETTQAPSSPLVPIHNCH